MRSRLAPSHVTLLVLLSLGCTRCPSARADYDETERRLKTAGVDDALRARIHAAIDKGVDFLVKRQRADGSFADHWKPPADSPMAGSGFPSIVESNVDGITLLCALALRHAGTPATDAPVRRAMARSFDQRVNCAAIESRVYQAGIALMLLASTPGRESEAKRIAGALAGALDEKTGWWGYNTPGGNEDPEKPRAGFRAETPNISTAQFAALGLWAARRMGIRTADSVWERHAATLCDRQRKTGSWDYSDDSRRVVGKVPPGVTLPEDEDTTNTYMGVANLLLAKQALATSKRPDAKLLARLDAAIAKAKPTLARDAAATLKDPRAFDTTFASDAGGLLPPGLKLPLGGPIGRKHTHALSPGLGAYYTLYALEKACLFADIESFEAPGAASPTPDPDAKPGKKPKPAKPGKPAAAPRLEWYATGAKWLLSAQRKDGGWSPDAGDPPGDDPSEIETAFALLFLLRSPSVFHPTTPTPVDARPRAVTPSDSAPAADGRAPTDDGAGSEKPPEAPKEPDKPSDAPPAMDDDPQMDGEAMK